MGTSHLCLGSSWRLIIGKRLPLGGDWWLGWCLFFPRHLSFLHVDVLIGLMQHVVVVPRRLPDERTEEITIHEPLRERVHHCFRGDRWNVQGHLVEALIVRSERLPRALLDGKQADACLLVAPTASKMMEEGRSEFLETGD